MLSLNLTVRAARVASAVTLMIIAVPAPAFAKDGTNAAIIGGAAAGVLGGSPLALS